MGPQARRGWPRGGLAGLILLTGCASGAGAARPDDLEGVRSGLLRVEQGLRAGSEQAERSAQTLADLQRTVARLSARVDELDRELGRVQGRLDDRLRRIEKPGGNLEPRPAADATEPPPPAGDLRRSQAASPQDGAASELYQTAYRDYTRGNYSLAVAAFRELIRRHPDSELAEMAQYWIGESHFSLAHDLQTRGEPTAATRELEQAAEEFRRVLVSYPRGDRVPAALYKEALVLIELGRIPQAEVRLQFLIDQFPTSEEAAKARDDVARIRRR